MTAADSGPAGAVHRYAGPEYARLLAAARRSLERSGGQLDGRIGITNPDEAERRAVIGITGIRQPAGARRLTVALAELDRALRRATGQGLAAVLTELSGPVRDRPAQAAVLESARAELIALAQASPLHESCPWFRQWLAELITDGTITRLASRPAEPSLGRAVTALELLADWPADATPIALPAFAAQVTGDTKAMNHGTTLATLILRGLARKAGTDRPASAAQRRELWDLSNVIVDDLASRVLVLNVAARGAGLGDWLTGAASYGTPFQITLHQLATHPIRFSGPSWPQPIFACENPAILRRACAELGPGCPPLVCTEGRPSTAFHRLIRLARADGAELRYHGDFDWPGAAIAAEVIARHEARPWRMGAADYLAATRARADGHYLPLAGEPVATPWDPGLARAMQSAGRAVYEESVADQLLADLADVPLTRP